MNARSSSSSKLDFCDRKQRRRETLLKSLKRSSRWLDYFFLLLSWFSFLGPPFPFIHPFVRSSIYPSIRPSIHPSIQSGGFIRGEQSKESSTPAYVLACLEWNGMEWLCLLYPRMEELSIHWLLLVALLCFGARLLSNERIPSSSSRSEATSKKQARASFGNRNNCCHLFREVGSQRTLPRSARLTGRERERESLWRSSIGR